MEQSFCYLFDIHMKHFLVKYVCDLAVHKFVFIPEAFLIQYN